MRLKVKRDSYAWLEKAAIEVNTVWNWAADVSDKAVRRYVGPPKWLSGFDLCQLSVGATKCFERIGAETIQSICNHYASKRKEAKRTRLAWRKSHGARRSLGWVPFKSTTIKRKRLSMRFSGKNIRVFEFSSLATVSWQDGCFAQDAMGDWWLCLHVTMAEQASVAPLEIVGIDLGLKDIATTSDGERLCSRPYRHLERAISKAQRRGHKRAAKRLHRKAARQRHDALHKFSRKVVDAYQTIRIGDVSSRKMARTRMAKSVLDAGWGLLKTQLLYKGQQAGRSVEVVREAYTTRACSSCGALSGPNGLRQLSVRQWCCSECGTEHDRDINAARNIAARPRCKAAVCGNESPHGDHERHEHRTPARHSAGKVGL